MVQSLIPLLPLILLGVQAAPEPQVKLGPAPKGCSKFEIIVARGTSEPGPFGSIVGDPLVRAVNRAVPGSRGYACQYPATTDLKHSAGLGMDDVINRLHNQGKNCPEQRFALVGYSQGAGVIHGIFQGANRTYPGAKGKLPVLENEALPKILAVVTFGDPGFMGETNSNPRAKLVFPIPKDFQAKTMINCSHGDPNCDPGGGSFANHLKYSGNPWQRESSDFIIKAFTGQPLPDALKIFTDPRWKKYP